MRADRVARAVRQEVSSFQLRTTLARLLMAPLPLEFGMRTRALILRLAGFRVGKGVGISGTPRLFGAGQIHRRLAIGDQTFINAGLTVELGAEVRIGRAVDIGPDVMILTTSHEIGTPDRRTASFQTAPVRVGDGAWIGARAIVLPGVTVGPGSIVAAGAILTRDVAANTVVAGVPARVVRVLDEPRQEQRMAAVNGDPPP